jgi:pyruvate dehydrogenase E1 component alpha subunit
MAMKHRGEKNVAIAFFGDGGTSSDGFHLGLNFGGVYDAPVVFFCQNNQWAISVPIEKQTRSETIAIKAKAYGIPGVRVDGTDVLAVYAATKEAVDRAREGKGPTLIEALTFRMGPHSSSDDPTRYRPKEKVEEWERNDPLRRFQVFLARQKLWDEEFEKHCQEGAKEAISAAVTAVEKAPPPAPETMFEGVFETLPPELALQRDALVRLSAAGRLTGRDDGYFPL